MTNKEPTLLLYYHSVPRSLTSDCRCDVRGLQINPFYNLYTTSGTLTYRSFMPNLSVFMGHWDWLGQGKPMDIHQRPSTMMAAKESSL
jgi:hypothetical protein